MGPAQDVVCAFAQLRLIQRLSMRQWDQWRTYNYQFQRLLSNNGPIESYSALYMPAALQKPG